MGKDTRIKVLSTYRIYYQTGNETFDVYYQGFSVGDVIDRVKETDPDAIIIEIAKVLKGWK